MTLDPIAKPIAAVLAFFYSLIPNYGVAIVLLTVLVMLILTPLTIKQTRSMLVMQKLQPELKRLQEQHKNDRQALNEAVMALYKEHNASPLGGCLPMLLPFPVFLALFRVLEGLSRKVHGQPVPKYLSSNTQMFKDIVHAGGHLNAFGMDLAKSASNVGGSFLHKLPYFIVLLIMVGTQYYQQRQLTARNPQAAQGQQQQIMKFIPLFFGVISIRFPAGVVLYWTVSNGIRILQQWAMYRYDPKVKTMMAQDVREVEAKTREIDDRQRSKPRFRDLLSGAADTSKPAVQKPPPRPTGNRQGPAGNRQGPGKPPSKGSASQKGSGGAKPGTGSKPGGTPTKPASGRPAPASGKSSSAKPPAARPNGRTPGNGQGNGQGNGDSAEGADATPKPAVTPPKPAAKGPDGTPNRTGGGPSGRTGGSAARPGNRSKRRGR
jgi:YidC/Oxa1 family membrane protein insertase